MLEMLPEGARKDCLNHSWNMRTTIKAYCGFPRPGEDDFSFDPLVRSGKRATLFFYNEALRRSTFSNLKEVVIEIIRKRGKRNQEG